MITLPLLPIYIVDIIGSLGVLLVGWACFRVVRRLRRREPDNALYLYFYWLTLSLLAFGVSRSGGHVLQHLLVFSGHEAVWQRLQPVTGGLNTITFVGITAVGLFFYHIQQIYRRMLANHQQLEATTRDVLELNREMETLVMERTMSEMALGIADGIRNPLHIIGGFSQRLLRKAAPDDPARTWAEAIAQEARRLECMVERFEALARRKESFFTQEDLNVIISETLEMLQAEAESRGLQLLASYHDAPIYCRVNKHLVKVALAHLVRNSIEATPPQGEIHCSTSVERSLALLTIEDTGRGMPSEIVAKVFVPFYTTKVGGTGLGMVFVRQIVEEHRGVINLESQVSQGTRVSIRLPLRFAEPRLAPEVQEAEAGSPVRSLNQDLVKDEIFPGDHGCR
jgi:signal transduction histidine kinase